ncbi:MULTISPECIES: PLP-dependent aminotransferase family protein [unclassified Roseateles]|uniref:aminotransferase-like domain-containing protein n=1 Tax=unclassified Roseateles TaxID=2626991 RepID=UPI0006FE493A|nr:MULTISPECIES: PLP-dependent aminotransferase family protein [unclassified Roseateles]KQW46570.1 GntR family transcriptional regulator [Pelomonas sp. Root405]KRA73621.1 GntR family transcriptional regulator [Pelomonas sp. Root662]
MFSLDRDSPTPLADQIEQRLHALIASHQLPPGARLNSIRQLAARLGVSPNTVVVAYDRLVAAGVIDSRGTAGFFVADGPADAMPDAARVEAGEEQEAVWLAQQANDQKAGVLLASSGALPATWLEDAIPAAAVQRGLARASAGMASRCPPQGLPELRDRIAMLLRGQGLAVDAGRVLTTYGGTQAIDLICRAFLRPGDAVAVETPGYFLLFDRLRQAGVTIVPVPRRPDGIDLEALDAACTRHRPRLLFIQSVLHNPTGWGSTAANLHRVLMLAQRHDFLVAEDDVQGHFHPGTPTRLAQLSGLDRVIYYSSFCKAMSPALRLGYIAAEPALLKPLMREKIFTVLTTAALNEYVLLEVLAAGRWRKHLDRLQQRLGAARAAASQQLRQAGVLLEHAGEGGLFLWGALPAGVDVDGVVREAFRAGILLVRGATFAADGAADAHIRFNAAFSQQPRLAEFLRDQLSAATSAQRVVERARAAAR